MRTTREHFFPRVPARGRCGMRVALSGMVYGLAASLAFSTAPSAAPAPKIDAETQQAILDCTFEVIAQMRGAEGTRAAPLVQVAGSAFCIGDGQLATAAHVFDQALGGRFDSPFVRDRAGHAYPVDRILRYSTRDDFVVFTVAGLPALPARPHNTTREIGSTLYLAWRRGDGDIAFGSTQYRGRSTTAAFGRDDWIQFGPAPGHGASGAALLDNEGRIVGLISRRGSERADAQGFAAPIQLLDDASTDWADITMRDPLRVLDMPSERNLPLLGGIPLPAPLARFEKHMREVRSTYFAHTLPYSLSLAGVNAPMRDAQRGALCAALSPGYCADDSKASVTPVRSVRKRRGCEVLWSGVGVALVRCNAPDALAASRMAENPRMQTESVSLARQAVPVPPAPCRNDDPLEDLAETESFADHTGALWQVRARPVRGCDWVILSMSRALPDGTLTLVRGAPSAYADAAAMQLKALTAIRRGGEQVGDGEPKDAILAGRGGTQNEVSR